MSATCHPAGLVKVSELVRILPGGVFIETILDHIQLQVANYPDNLPAIHLTGEELGYTFVHQLVQALDKLLGFQWIIIVDITKDLRTETGHSLEMQDFTSRKDIADLEIATVIQADHIAGECFIDDFLLEAMKEVGLEKRNGRACRT